MSKLLQRANQIRINPIQLFNEGYCKSLGLIYLCASSLPLNGRPPMDLQIWENQCDLTGTPAFAAQPCAAIWLKRGLNYFETLEGRNTFADTQNMLCRRQRLPKELDSTRRAYLGCQCMLLHHLFTMLNLSQAAESASIFRSAICCLHACHPLSTQCLQPHTCSKTIQMPTQRTCQSLPVIIDTPRHLSFTSDSPNLANQNCTVDRACSAIVKINEAWFETLIWANFLSLCSYAKWSPFGRGHGVKRKRKNT